MANTNCCGGTSTTTTTCDSTIAELPRYYPRQLITPDDLTLEQNYFRDRMRRHNRLLHGWGVVCGALVCAATTTNSDNTISLTPWQVKVQKGYILGPYGDEIIIDCCRTVDLRTSGVSGVTGEPCVDTPDPWCSQVYTSSSNTTFYIAVQYKQCMMRPVRVQPVGCGCNDNTCEYSRWHDGYEIGVLTTKPTCLCTTKDLNLSFQELMGSPVPTCPDCSCGPWVYLATVTVSADGMGTIQTVDNCSCRRMVLSLSSLCWIPKCAGTTTTVKSVVPTGQTSGTPQVTADGTTRTPVTVNGMNLQIETGVTYSFGAGITATVDTTTSTAAAVNLAVVAETYVQTGQNYNLTIINADCSVVIPPQGNAIFVVASGSQAVAPGGPSNAAASVSGVGDGGDSPAKPSPAAKVASGKASAADKASKSAKS